MTGESDMKEARPISRYFVIASKEADDLWFFADGEHGRQWVIRPYQAKRFRTFREAETWMQGHLPPDCEVSEIVDADAIGYR